MTLQQGIHPNIPIEVYIRDPAPEPSLSTRIAKALIDECPARAWYEHPRLNPAYESEDNSATDLGKIVHAVLLEGDTSKLVQVTADDWRTKAAREQRDLARSEGKIPILASKWPEIEAMVGVAQKALKSVAQEIGILPGEPLMVEQTIVWQEGKVWCRARPDLLHTDGLYVIDFKTTATSAHPNVFPRQIISMGYDLQAGLIRAGVYAVTGKTPDVVFMVQETSPPYLVSFVGLDPYFADIADKKVEKAIERWAYCIANNRWDGYPPMIAWAQPPAWALAQAEEIMGR